MVLLIRNNECFEPRVRNYLRWFQRQGIAFHVIAWNRSGTARPEDHITFFQHRAQYGSRLGNIPHKLSWMWFVIRQIWKWRKDCTAIHACDIDAVLPALLAGKPMKKTVIFDIFDWISSPTGSGLVYRILERLQNFAYARCDAVILCEEERKAQAKTANPNVLVLPNIPDHLAAQDPKTAGQIALQRQGYDLTVSYVGVFDRDRGLENLLACVSRHPNVLLNIAGFGVLGEQVAAYARQYPNICCWGRVDYPVGQAVLKQSDLMAAMYHLTSPLHRYAAPNKYYESLLLEVPLVTTANTLVGAKTARHDTGFVLDESPEALEALLSDPGLMQAIRQKQEHCKAVWETVYKNYFTAFMQEKYLPVVKLG